MYNVSRNVPDDVLRQMVRDKIILGLCVWPF